MSCKCKFEDGNRIIRGCCIPSAFIIAPMKLMVVDYITAWHLKERVVFGLSTLMSEDLQDNLSESVVFGLSKLVSEDLQSNLSESVSITNV